MPFLTNRSAPPIPYHEPGRSENEGRDPLGFPQPPIAQALDRNQKNLMGEVGSSLLIAQVSQAVQPNSRGKPPVEFTLRVAGLPGSG
jgi:hypothetical protein